MPRIQIHRPRRSTVLASLALVGTCAAAHADLCPSSPDLNVDGVVDSGDLGLMLAEWGPCNQPCAGDLNLDEAIDSGDLGLLLAAWGPVSPPEQPIFIQPVISAGAHARQVEVHDFDKDGDLDIAILGKSTSSENALMIGWRQPGLLQFEFETFSWDSSGGEAAMVVADVDGDGWSDLFTVYGGSRLFRNDGGGRFLPPQVIDGSSYQPSARVGDLDGDGTEEILAISSDVVIYRYAWDGTALVKTLLFNLPGETHAIELFDVDLDGDLDLAIRRADPYVLETWTNDGTGAFEHTATLPPVYGLMRAADVNGDGWPDLVSGGLSVSLPPTICFNDGNGTLLAPAPFVQSGLAGFCLEDVDGDGDIDILGGTENGSRLRVHLNDGSGTFTTSQSLIVPLANSLDDDPTVIDLDGDCIPEALVVCMAGVAILPGSPEGFLAPSFPVPDVSMVAAYYCALATLDYDDHLDLVGGASGTARVYWGLGDGTFEPSQSVGFGSNYNSFGAVDVTLDGLPALIGLNSFNQTLATRPNLGDRTFGPSVVVATAAEPTMVVPILADGDHLGDAAVLCSGTGVAIHRGALDGSLLPGEVVSVPEARKMTVGDLDGNGTHDLLLGLVGGSIRALFGDGAGAFELGEPFGAGVAIAAIALGDLDGDGDLDAVAAHHTGTQANVPALLQVWLNLGDGSFAPGAAALVQWHPEGVQFRDMDKDGALDLVAIDDNRSRMILLRGDGFGAFGPTEYFGLNWGSALDVGDVDGDGWLDVVNVPEMQGRGSVLLNLLGRSSNGERRGRE